MNNVNDWIEDFIPFGEENAVTRHELAVKTGLRDREVREEIALARRAIPILSTGKGYYRPREDETEKVERWIKQETNRLKSIAWSLYGARMYLKERIINNG